MNTSKFPESLESLMQRSLEGLTSPDEEIELKRALADDPVALEKFESMKADFEFWEEYLCPALKDASLEDDEDGFEAPPMPDHVLQRLREVADTSWAERRERESASKITSFTVVSSSTATPAARSIRPGVWLALAAAVAATLVVLTRILPESGAPMAKVALLAPNPGAPSPFVDPIFVWESRDEPGQQYDVWILPEDGDQITTKPLYVAENVTSPLPLTAMKNGDAAATGLPEGGYQVLICLADAGRHAGVARPFAVAADATPVPDLASATPGELQLQLQEMLGRSPEAALMAIATLSAERRKLPEVALLEKAARERISVR